jgi:hypothetical protein
MNAKGQATMETGILILVIIGALFAMQVYLKRGIQGRLRLAATNIGEEYDPATTNSFYVINHVSNTLTTVNTLAPAVVPKSSCGPGGCAYWNETVTPSITTVETLYDITNKSSHEEVGGF